MIRNTFKTFANKLRAVFHRAPQTHPPVVVEIPTPSVIQPSAEAKRRHHARPLKVVRLLRTRQGETSGDHT